MSSSAPGPLAVELQPDDPTGDNREAERPENSSEVHDLPVLPEHFVLSDERSASWVIQKINEARAHKKRVAEWAALETRRAERDEQFFWMRFGRDLEEWARKKIAELRGRRRSVDLPGGRIGLRKVGPLLVVEDEQAVIAWASSSCPEAIAVTTRLSKAAINAHVEATGELPPIGVRVEPARDKLFIS